eukprot:6179419-Pleurochrysis_carterae.AAC.6
MAAIRVIRAIARRQYRALAVAAPLLARRRTTRKDHRGTGAPLALFCLGGVRKCFGGKGEAVVRM